MKLFTKSPLRNKAISNYLKTKEKKELSLLLDCSIRCNTSASMVKQIFHLVNSSKNASKDLNMDYVPDVLKPALIAIEAISRNETTLLSADGGLRTFLNTRKKSICFC